MHENRKQGNIRKENTYQIHPKKKNVDDVKTRVFYTHKNEELQLHEEGKPQEKADEEMHNTPRRSLTTAMLTSYLHAYILKRRILIA